MSFNWAKIEIDSDDTIPITKLLNKFIKILIYTVDILKEILE